MARFLALEDDVSSTFWFGAFIGVGSYAIVRAAYPDVDVFVLTAGSLVVLAAAYVATLALARTRERDEADDEFESTETERLLVERLNEVEPDLVNELEGEHAGVRRAIDDLIEIWATQGVGTLGEDEIEEPALSSDE